MKNIRWSRLAACFLALVMLLAMVQFAAYASDVENPENPENPATEEKAPEEAISAPFKRTMATVPYDTTHDVAGYTEVSYIGADGNVTDQAYSMNPNVENRVQLTITGLDAEPRITKDTTLVWNIPDDITITGIDSLSSDEVTGTVEGSTLLLDWLGEKADQVTVSVPVIPHAEAYNDLSGSYVLVTAGNVMLGFEAKKIDSRDKLNAYSIQDENGGVWIGTIEDPVWTLNHVSGDYYTVRLADNGKYLQIDKKGNGLSLVSTSEQEAQKILLKQEGNYYAFIYDGWAVNNSNSKPEKGFGSWEYAGGDNEKFKLYSPSDILIQAATYDLSGTWMLANETDGNRRFISSGSSNSGTLDAVSYNWNDDNIAIPNDDINDWTIEHVKRDLYYVYSDAGYLNISADGVSVSSTPQLLQARTDQNFSTIILTDGQYTLKRGGNDNKYFEKTNVGYGGNRLTLIDPDRVANAPVNISGSWAIITESKDTALIVNPQNGKLESTPFETREDGKIFYPGKNITLWNFNHVRGNWYTISTEDESGKEKYLFIGNNKLRLDDNYFEIYIQEYRGKYRLNGIEYASLRAEGGYKGATGAKAKDINEWQTLRPVFTGGVNVLTFDVNGGSAVEVPAAVMGEAGDKVTLPDMQASKDGHEFIGWYYKNADYYAGKASNESSTCRPLLTPGTEYTLPRGTTTLYAVYNKTSRNIRFGIRKDGVIQDEPNNYPSGSYVGHFWMDGIRESNIWIIDTNPTKSVNDYYLENNVTASLSQVPTAARIQKALKDEGNIPFDPETQYIHWYVLKWTGSEWHIDGVIRNKAQVEIAYEANVSDPNEKMNIEDFPGSYQVPVGSQILIGAAKNSDAVLTPKREGYVFRGWNTKSDGTGTTYNAGGYIELRENLHLYAQWTDVSEGKLAIVITSDWPDGKPAYVGTKIKLTANLTGFDNKDYTLQWQHSTDQETWIDEPGANDIDFTFEVTETTGQYTWRVVARDVRDKE